MTNNCNFDQTLESYKIIFESSLDAILLTQPDGTIIYANSAAEELYGYTQQEICDLGRSGIVDTTDPNLKVILDERARLGKSKGEITLIKKDGSKFPAEVSTSIFKDENGKVNTFMIIRDITQRKQNEKQIEYHAQLLSKVNDAVIGTDSNFNITYWNHGAELMYGYTEKEVMGKPSVEIIRPIYAPGEREIILNEIEKKGTSKSIIRTKHRNGTEIIVDFNSNRILDEQKNISGYLVVYRDITEQKRVEKQTKETQQENKFLADIIENASLAFAIGYPDGRIGLLNQAFEQLTGYTKEELQTIDWSTTLTPIEWWEMENQKVDELNRTGQPVRYEKEYIRKDGSRVPVELLASITFDNDGNPGYYYSFITDITDRKKAEEIIETTMSELKHSNKELEQFAHITSHDLREPLRMITSFLQLLERRYKDQLDEDANEFIGFAVDGAKRLDAMTNDLLQYSKITSEKREIKPVNFEHVLEKALTNLTVQIEENNAIITHDHLPTIIGDEQLKVQLFQNLISNSIKYHSQETPKIHISVTKENNQYLFSFRDNGIGISPEHLERIFTIFQRLHTHEEYEGTGIGLSIAQKIVYQQGGQIWAESELGKGSTFYFTIPLSNNSSIPEEDKLSKSVHVK